ncbi:DUF4301 family protein [Aestuariivivens sp. NBU2969]|uniref:DUF4301 family protein n=1 Tax=Aestuariivivens sp. NBU2969 TaxID=2873267 RepID=UPI001CBC6CEC|nr:DUF4301 family protein [Aestuariivivens sp. NBU2969]
MNFTDNDIQQIQDNDLTLEQVNQQIERIKKGASYTNLAEAATVGNGILRLTLEERNQYVKTFEEHRNRLSLVKFVPASGAATRMFKFLFQFLKAIDVEKDTINGYINRHKNSGLAVFFAGLEKLPFFEEVVHRLHEIIPNFNDLSYDQKRIEFIKTMLDEDRLNYSAFPKGLLPFHRYKQHVTTAFEEHLFEAALYAASNNKANVHFTISPNHNKGFEEEFKFIEEDVEEETGTCFDISFSNQKKSTDTIALTIENEIYREPNGKLLFRASGHGALLENLNALEYDIIFIKNIDNVTVLSHHEELAEYKKLLAGVLIETQKQSFRFLHELDNELDNEELFVEILEFLTSKFNQRIEEAFLTLSITEKKAFLKHKLNRPIRVGGIVKNEKEPGGGPFWVKDKDGNVSLQIVEFTQINMKDTAQKEIVKNATHFNPTDFVCGIKNYKGEVFNLKEFVDNDAYFVTVKSRVDTEIKALERPGLWNGSMAYWNSIFVEVPLVTFNPVKTVNDLLKAPHQYL